MVNAMWLGLVLASIVLSVLNGTTAAVVASITVSCQMAIKLVIGLAGVMAFWLGLMRVAERAGLIAVLAKALGPVLRRLFHEVPEQHPAMGAMTMNIAANMLGIGNAATPFGLRAMEQLATLSDDPRVATNAMCAFLAINTSSVQLLPMSAIAILAASGDPHPTAIILPALLATSCSTVAAIIAVRIAERATRVMACYAALQRGWLRLRTAMKKGEIR